jgi:DNA polymerase, archaea type
METKKFLLLDLDYITKNSKPVIRLFGKLPDGRSIIALDRKFRPYIYVLPLDLAECIDELMDLGLHNLEKIRKKDNGITKEFVKIILNHPRDLTNLREKIRNLKSVEDIREHDIHFHGRYLIAKGLFPLSKVDVQGKVLNRHLNGTCTFEIQGEPHQVKSDLSELNILSFKIETCNPQGVPQVGTDPIIIISLYSNQGFSRVFSTKESSSDFVETVPTEKELLEKFVETIKLENPDIITGYNSDKFDFPYMKNRADIWGVPLNLGVDGSNIRFMTGRMKAANIKGRIHVDLYKIARRYLQLNDHTLERVYMEFYKEEKIDIPAEEIYKCWVGEVERLENLFRHALEDVKAISQIGDKMLKLIIELTRIVGQPMFEVARRGTGTQVKWYLIRKAHENGDMVPNEFGRFERNIVGGYVQEPIHGLYEDIYYFDFRSLYPSIIVSKNISPETLTDDEKEDCYIAPEFGYRFRKEPIGFIPSVVNELLEGRMKIKAEMKNCKDPNEYQMLDFRQDAVKRLSSTVYGLFNHPNFRWYCVKCSEAITAWGKDYLQKNIKKAEENGFKVIYADTDGFYATSNEITK